jgi:hypothetical protein
MQNSKSCPFELRSAWRSTLRSTVRSAWRSTVRSTLLLSPVLLVGSTLVACGDEHVDALGTHEGALTQRPYELVLYERAVSCTPSARGCADPRSGELLAGEKLTGTTVLTPSLQLAGSGNRRAKLRLTRRSGAVGELALELPLADPRAWAAAASVGASVDPPTSYRERDSAGAVVFEAQLVSGALELPQDASCRCQDIVFTLRLVDAGADGLLRTTDDRLRQLELGLIQGGSGGSACAPSRYPPRGYLPGATLQVLPRDCVGGGDAGVGVGSGGGLPGGGHGEADGGAGVDAWLDAAGGGSGSGSGGGIGGSGGGGGGNSSFGSGGSGGCSGGGGGCSSSSGGCDSSGCDSGGGGCEGDAGGGGCAGDSGGGCGGGGGSGCGGGGGAGCGGGGATACAVARGMGQLPNSTLLVILLGLLGGRMGRRYRERMRRR